METIQVNNILYYLPASVADLQQLVKQARNSGVQLRVRGSGHSVNNAINPDGQQDIWVMLSKMNSVTIDRDNKIVDVQGGCHLGYDPFDPTQTSTWKNSLFCLLDEAGFAVPDMGGIIHQTVAGFLSTGSAGGSTQYSFNESLLSITILPADSDEPQTLTFAESDGDTDGFFAAGVSLGLLGIIVSAKFGLIPKFNIKGQEAISSIDDCVIDMTGKGVAGKTSLKKFLTETPYSRLLWYPQPHVSRVTVWQAAQMQPGDPFQRKPYQELAPILGTTELPEVAADLVYSAFGQYPDWLGNLMGTNNSAYKAIKSYVDENFYTTIFPEILPLFVTEDKDNKTNPGQPQYFEDFWYSSLPMDNNMSDKLFPVEFTELWIPFDDSNSTDVVAEVLKVLNKVFDDYYSNHPSVAAGAFCTELYAGKKSKFWLSPSYGSDVFRVDVFWFGHNIGSPATAYYPLFWEALAPFNFRCHWGKYLPAPASDQGVNYLKKQYEKWKAFHDLRKKLDPKQIFVNNYWRKQLGIEPVNSTV